jgi:MtN3 and saliva related transmembrane protein
MPAAQLRGRLAQRAAALKPNHAPGLETLWVSVHTKDALDLAPRRCFIYYGMTQYLGYFAGLLTVGAFLPQVVRAWRTRQTRDLSLATFALLITTGSLWMIYGVVTKDWPVIAANGGMVTLNVALAVAKLRYG